jgi:hypothetical protein
VERPVVRFAAALLAVIAVAGCEAGDSGGPLTRREDATAGAGATRSGPAYVLRGTFTRKFRGGTYKGRLRSRAEVASWVGCVDLGGSVAAVLDASGEWIGTAVTEHVDDCGLTFAIEVPRAARYKIMVGSFDGPTYSFDELEGLDFRIQLSQTLGPAAIDVYVR